MLFFFAEFKCAVCSIDITGYMIKYIALYINKLCGSDFSYNTIDSFCFEYFFCFRINMSYNNFAICFCLFFKENSTVVA